MQLRRFSVSGLSIILSALAANAFSNSGKEIASSDARRSESSKIVEVANNEKSKQFRIEPKTWTFKGHDIAYEKSQSIPLDLMDSPQDLSSIEELEEPILLLNGFGVGSFHQHRLKENLAQEMSTLNNSVRNIYGIDYLGQGKSWPSNCDDGCSESERGLAYNIDLWSMQVIMFIEEVVIAENSKNEKCKVHLVGNSVGGHLATIIANERPDLIRSISLLNATPVWGLGLPGWDAKLPAPFIPKAIGRFLFDRIRDYDTIKLYLAQAYSRPEAFDDELLQQIRSCTEGKGGYAAFASIIWSSPSSVLKKYGSFTALVSKLSCDVLLLFGDDDTWCKPAYAKHMMKVLNERDEPSLSQRYLALSNTAHCPNHEAPQAVAHALSRWVSSKNRMNLAVVDGPTTWQEKWGTITMREVKDDEFDDLSASDRLMIRMLA